MPEQAQEGISALMESYQARFGVPATVATNDPQMKASANQSIPGSAPDDPALDPQQAYIAEQAGSVAPEEVALAKKKKLPPEKKQAVLIAEVIRQLAQDDQDPVLDPTVSPDPAAPLAEI